MRLIALVAAMAAAAPALAQPDPAPSPAPPEFQQEARDVARLLETLDAAKRTRAAELEAQRRADERLARRNASGSRLLRSDGRGASSVRVSRGCSPERPVSAVC